MVLPYTKFRSETPLSPYFLRSMINVRLINGNRSRTQKAIIDTGADYILINSSIAKDLGIDYKSGTKWTTTGIENRPIETYFHELEIEIPNLEKFFLKQK
jgi:predicted aspartyl protease